MKHSKKEVQEAIEYVLERDWRLEKGGHWGILYCPAGATDEECRGGHFCKFGVSSTPKSPSTHASQIRRVADNCVKCKQGENE